MQRSDTLYTLGFAAVVCLICSALVCSAAVILRGPQQANILFDRHKKILGVAELLPAGARISAAEADDLFDTNIEPTYIELATGERVADVP